MEKSTILRNNIEKSIDFETFLNTTKVNLESGLIIEEDIRNYTSLNLQRTNRILNSYKPSDLISELICNISNKYYWVVITEDWCGDSAQNLPYIYKLAQINKNISLNIVYRDKNPELMDLYLTNGTKSIPKLICVNSEMDEVFVWGPRPKEAQEVVNNAKESGLGKDEMMAKLHLWYSKNRGLALEGEFVGLIKLLK